MTLTTFSYGQVANLRVVIKEVNVLELEGERFKEIQFHLVGQMSAAKVKSVNAWSESSLLDEVWIKEVKSDIHRGYLRTNMSVKLIEVLEMWVNSGVTEIERKGEVMTISKAQELALERSKDQ